MSKKQKPTTQPDTRAIMRRLAWQGHVEAMRDGRVLRATTFVDRRKQADRQACRGKVRNFD